jgi:hypothetical protein
MKNIKNLSKCKVILNPLLKGKSYKRKLKFKKNINLN